jgi:hypothetical protein
MELSPVAIGLGHHMLAVLTPISNFRMGIDE